MTLSQCKCLNIVDQSTAMGFFTFVPGCRFQEWNVVLVVCRLKRQQQQQQPSISQAPFLWKAGQRALDTLSLLASSFHCFATFLNLLSQTKLQTTYCCYYIDREGESSVTRTAILPYVLLWRSLLAIALWGRATRSFLFPYAGHTMQYYVLLLTYLLSYLLRILCSAICENL